MRFKKLKRFSSRLFIALFFIVQFAPVQTLSQDDPAIQDAATAPLNETPAGETLGPLTGKDGIDLICQSDVFYTWQARPPASSDGKATIPGDPAEVFFVTVGERGLVVEDVMNRLASKLQTIRTQAMEECRRKYQDQAQCVVTSLKSHAQDYNVMDFKARSSLLTAIEQDCANNTGVCLSTRVGETKCFLNRPPDSVPAEKEESAAGGAKQADKKAGAK